MRASSCPGFIAVAAIASTLMAASCGDSGQPPLQAPGQAAERPWISMSLQLTFCDFPTCPGATGFTVYQTGAFSLSPDGRRSPLTADEIHGLFPLIQLFLARDLNAPPQCVTFPPSDIILEYTLTLTTPAGSLPVDFDRFISP